MPNQIPLIVDRRGSVLTLSLNNPSKKNALNSEIMGALFAAIEETKKYEELRAIVIRGEGSVFCSGADVKNWKPNQLQILLKSIAECSLPTIAEVNGACLGGGMGLICACDFVVAKDSTHFGFPEVRIGMIPAVILPYVARKLTLSKIRELFITGERFDNSRAESLGILYHESNLDALVSKIEKGGPNAQKEIKSLLNKDIFSKSSSARDTELANLISKIREGSECIEGINSFLEKRQPNWGK